MSQPDFTKLFDIKALLDIQRKNILAFSQAHRLACEGLQAVAQRQMELFSQTVEESSSFIREIMAEGTAEEKTEQQFDRVKQSWEKSLADWHLLTSMIGGAGEEASNIINSRVISSLAEFKSALHKNDGDSKKIVQNKAA
jgi:phasin family protein